MLLFGWWHAGHYAYVAAWEEFGPTFLYPAFFKVFPVETLMGRPKQTHSATFFTWLRLAYPLFQVQLAQTLKVLKARLLGWELEYIKKVRREPDTAMERIRIGSHIPTC